MTNMQRATTILLAVLFAAVLVIAFPANAQQPTPEQQAAGRAVAQERSAHLSSLSDRAIELAAELAATQVRLRAAQEEVAAIRKQCGEPCAEKHAAK